MNFAGSLLLGLRRGADPRLVRGNLAVDRADFDKFWNSWEQGWVSGTLVGGLVGDSHWYTAIPRAFPPNESYLVLLSSVDWSILETIMRERRDPNGQTA
jgi:hypothetical protein